MKTIVTVTLMLAALTVVGAAQSSAFEPIWGPDAIINAEPSDFDMAAIGGQPTGLFPPMRKAWNFGPAAQWVLAYFALVTGGLVYCLLRRRPEEAVLETSGKVTLLPGRIGGCGRGSVAQGPGRMAA